MEFRQLECFIAVAANGSITKASEVLHISQPAVTKSIQLLEHDIGTPLFQRIGKRIVLNDAGRAVLEDAKEIVSHQQIIYHKAKMFRHTSDMRVTLLVTAASELIPELVQDFCMTYPTVRLQIAHRMPEPDETCVMLSSSLRGGEALLHHTVFSEELAIAVPPEHPLAQQASITLKELSNYPILGLTTTNDLRKLVDRLAVESHTALHYFVECDNAAMLCSLLSRGTAPAVVPTKSWPSINQMGVLLRPIRHQLCMRYINLQIVHPEHADENVRLLFSHIDAYFDALKQIHAEEDANGCTR